MTSTVCVINSSGNIKHDALTIDMRFFILAIFLFSTPVLAAKHILILGLDGVSYQTALKMHQKGAFKDFQSPIPMVATFPSISDPNWSHIIGVEPEFGYTKAGFNMAKNPDGSIGKEYGTLIDHILKPTSYEAQFNFRAESIFEHIMSMTWTTTSALYWTDSLLRYLTAKEHPKDVSSALILNTDIISHVGGEKKVKEYLKELDKKLVQLRKVFKEKHKRDLEIVLVSDHGNHYKVPTPIDYKKPLAKDGFNQTSTIKNKKDFAFVAPEIIAFGAFYCLPESRMELAKSFSNIKGVHVALIDLGNNQIGIYGKESEAVATYNPKAKTISYKIIKGKDPFGQIELFQGKPLTADEYFRRTLQTDYPNALVRAWEGFYKNSKQAGSVLVSPKLGYVFTNMTLQILTAVSGVQSTHGSFHREESFGLVMSTLPLKEEALRPQDFLKTIQKL